MTSTSADEHGAEARPRVLTVIDHYLPGYRSGGPVRSLAAWVDRMNGELTIKLVCVDRDLGDDRPYADVRTGTWTDQLGCQVLYLRRRQFGLRRSFSLVKESSANTVYLNTLFSARFCLFFLVAVQCSQSRPQVILAPRGQLCAGALQLGYLKRFKKQAFLRGCLLLRIFRDVHWQASSESEAVDIRSVVGPAAAITVAPNLRLRSQLAPAAREKVPGCARVIFLSRISPMKNLLFALDLLDNVTGTIHFTIVGPVGDDSYWARCQRRIASLRTNVTVQYEGAVPNEQVADLYSSHHLLLLPTLSENYGHAILEAMEMGTPVLISDQTPWRCLRQLNAGWDISLADQPAFVDALQHCIDLDVVGFDLLSKGASKAAVILAQDDISEQLNRSLFGLGPVPRLLERKGYPRLS